MAALATVVLVGGYGVIGLRVSKLLLKHHADSVRLVLAGRNPDKAREKVEAELGKEVLDSGVVRLVQMNAAQPQPLQRAGLAEHADVVLTLLVDLPQHIANEAVALGRRIVDITTAGAAAEQLQKRDPGSATIILAASWMGGVLPMVAVAVAQQLKAHNEVVGVDAVRMYSIMDENDLVGPDSATVFDSIADDFNAVIDGKPVRVKGMSDPRWIQIPARSPTAQYKTYSIDTVDVQSLPQTLSCRTASMHFGFSSATFSTIMAVTLRWGLLNWLPASVKTQLLNTSSTRPARVDNVVEVTPLLREGVPADAVKGRRVTVTMEQGQAQLTATSVFLLTVRQLGLDGLAPPPPGFLFSENSGMDLSPAFFDRLRSLDIAIDVQPL